ncbi:MAG: peptide MFS transporter [Acidobacteriota bacterium]|nr:peptide MFS transporter [Acidobacteriota bacterium]
MSDTGRKTGFFGHPGGLAVLFFTEMWERFGYYGMRGILMLYLTAAIADGGLEFDAADAGSIYAVFTSMVYLFGLPGGWIADRVIGQRRAVLLGGILIAAGYFAMALPGLVTFFAGLAVVVVGTGLLKTNISVIVGQLYAADDERRDAGFSLFYMGINLGAFIGPLACGFLGEVVHWQLGFAAAGVGMTLGVIIYLLGGRALGEAGRYPVRPDSPEAAAALQRQIWTGVVLGALGTVIIVALFGTGVIGLEAKSISNAFGIFLLGVVAVFFSWLFLTGDWTGEERGRLWAIVALFVAASIFWAVYEQAGSSLTLFADRNTDRVVGSFPEFPASWFQPLPAIFVILQAPFWAWLWIRLGKRAPSSPAKFALGLIFVGLGTAVMIGASVASAGGVLVSPMWLITTYFLHVVGEMFLSPVGLSTVTKLAPDRVGSLMMGVWFLASAVGNYVGGRAAGLYETLELPTLFGIVTAIPIAAGVLLLVLAPAIRRLMGGVH